LFPEDPGNNHETTGSCRRSLRTFRSAS
jgi:hypothetical protein